MLSGIGWLNLVNCQLHSSLCLANKHSGIEDALPQEQSDGISLHFGRHSHLGPSNPWGMVDSNQVFLGFSPQRLGQPLQVVTLLSGIPYDGSSHVPVLEQLFSPRFELSSKLGFYPAKMLCNCELISKVVTLCLFESLFWHTSTSFIASYDWLIQSGGTATAGIYIGKSAINRTLIFFHNVMDRRRYMGHLLDQVGVEYSETQNYIYAAGFFTKHLFCWLFSRAWRCSSHTDPIGKKVLRNCGIAEWPPALPISPGVLDEWRVKDNLPIEAYSQPSSQLLLTGDQDSASYCGFYDVSEPSTSANDPIIGFSLLPTYHLVEKQSAGSRIQLSTWKFEYILKLSLSLRSRICAQRLPNHVMIPLTVGFGKPIWVPSSRLLGSEKLFNVREEILLARLNCLLHRRCKTETIREGRRYCKLNNKTRDLVENISNTIPALRTNTNHIRDLEIKDMELKKVANLNSDRLFCALLAPILSDNTRTRPASEIKKLTINTLTVLVAFWVSVDNEECGCQQAPSSVAISSAP
ncbi:hypothetical protein PAAG_03293 [Paracoccidioides lutzii Pb01]|uniref:Uncharacterized protein n=1 Tax=Paracoccidioides lutzii (strain ATCC MYA-826 / Pb01) TaxID=502779 RepID=C1GY10_PARBA|nr:hypothetical protein PAAG_03293 [Paracoccidioides lutzii Pb01]EEH41730.2 hypothetical protein PAAG_03293 [Paracoccidioides lutzii Pb01]